MEKRKPKQWPLGFGIIGHQIVRNNGSTRPADADHIRLWNAYNDAVRELEVRDGRK